MAEPDVTTPEWLQAINAQSAGGSGWDGRQYTDPKTGQYYTTVNSGRDESGLSQATGYSSTDGKAWHPGQMGQSYDLQGNAIGSPWEATNFNEDDWLDKLALAVPLAMVGGAAFSALGGTLPSWAGGAGATSGAGEGMVNGAFLGEAPWTATPGATALDFGAGAGAFQGTSAGMQGLAGSDAAFNSAMAGGAGLGTIGAGGAAAATLGKAALGGVGGGGSSGLGGIDLGKLISGGYDAYSQGKASDKMLEWLKSRTDITDNLYSEGSPEKNLLRQQMERKDAAAGRNSQYGPREVDLAAKIAQIKAAENTKMTTGIGQWMNGSINQDASKYSGLLAALGGQNGGSGLTLDSIMRLFGGD